MHEYLYNACHTFFATTTTPHYPNSKLGQQQQTNTTNQYESRHTGGEEALRTPDKKGPLTNAMLIIGNSKEINTILTMWK
jgi:hypothetical protein